MFAVGASYLSLLRAVAARCGLPYADVVSEVAGDGTPIYGVEIGVPSPQVNRCSSSIFFWAPEDAAGGAGHEQAALQAISFLQGLYGFVVVDYNFQAAILYRRIATAAVSVAFRATALVKLVSGDPQASVCSRHELVVQCESFLKEISLFSLLV